jgi:hypothetical protein
MTDMMTILTSPGAARSWAPGGLQDEYVTVTHALYGFVDADYRQDMNRLQTLASLPAGWDLEGSPPIRPAAIQGALRGLTVSQWLNLPAPQIIPVSGGGLQLEWSTADGAYVEIYFLPIGGAEYIFVNSDGAERDGVLSVGMEAPGTSILLQALVHGYPVL